MWLWGFSTVITSNAEEEEWTFVSPLIHPERGMVTIFERLLVIQSSWCRVESSIPELISLLCATHRSDLLIFSHFHIQPSFLLRVCRGLPEHPVVPVTCTHTLGKNGHHSRSCLTSSPQYGYLEMKKKMKYACATEKKRKTTVNDC